MIKGGGVKEKLGSIGGGGQVVEGSRGSGVWGVMGLKEGGGGLEVVEIMRW